MSLPQKRDFISKMESLKSGFMTPGMIVDDKIDKQIQDLDKRFKDINFGQKITHKTFDYYKPKHMDKEKHAAEYRQWKLR